MALVNFTNVFLLTAIQPAELDTHTSTHTHQVIKLQLPAVLLCSQPLQPDPHLLSVTVA